MQELNAEATSTVRLVCGGCRHWEDTAIRAMPNGEPLGRCDRFGESRPGSARPRCNICWEPRTPVLRPVGIDASEAN